MSRFPGLSVPVAAMCKRITVDEERLKLAFESLDVDHTSQLDAATIKQYGSTSTSSVLTQY